MTLYKQWEAKIDQIANLIGRQLFGDNELTAEQKAEAQEAAQEAVDEWEMAEVNETAGLNVRTELQRLLAEQHELSEQILDERDR